MIQLRNVPDMLHRKLKARAALEGMSLSEYLIAEVRRGAERPSVGELRVRLAERAPVTPSPSPGRGRSRGTEHPLIAVDASAMLEVLLRTERGARIEDRLLSRGESLHAPHLLDVEVAQVLRRYAGAGSVTAARGRQALTDLADFPIHRYPHDVLLPRIWELRQNATAYDAVYLALAELLLAPLVTCDRKLASTRGHAARVEVC